jgi:hypothetical protein
MLRDETRATLPESTQWGYDGKTHVDA